MLFNRNIKTEKFDGNFGYLKNPTHYFDSACQTLRPMGVIDAQNEYYLKYNACGHRVKYKWGEIVDKKVDETRELILNLIGKSSSKYTVAFGLNTTYGINLILHQINPNGFDKVVTSEIEHNSCFLPTITYSKNHNLKRVVLKREENGSLIYSMDDISKAIIVVNSTSNIDGRELVNIKQLVKDAHENDSLVLIDAAQTLGHNPELLKEVEFDVAFGSGHKMYAPSMGVIVITKDLAKKLNPFFIGGGTVSDVSLEEYSLINNDDELYSTLEPGLQNFGGIIGLGEAIKWKNNIDKNIEKDLSMYLYSKLKENKEINVINYSATSTISIYSTKIDAHRLAVFLSERDIMCRSGYFCCHYYLTKVMKLPPLLRISIGVNNTKEQIDFLIDSLNILVK